MFFYKELHNTWGFLIREILCHVNCIWSVLRLFTPHLCHVKGFLICTLNFIIWPYIEPFEPWLSVPETIFIKSVLFISSRPRIYLPNSVSSWDFTTEDLYAFLISRMHAACLAHPYIISTSCDASYYTVRSAFVRVDYVCVFYVCVGCIANSCIIVLAFRVI
jgi:hypothetical protein